MKGADELRRMLLDKGLVEGESFNLYETFVFGSPGIITNCTFRVAFDDRPAFNFGVHGMIFSNNHVIFVQDDLAPLYNLADEAARA